MTEMTKIDKQAAKDIIRKGILHRHAQWHQELKALLSRPYSGAENEYDRSMEIMDKARKFNKEAMLMEEYYNSNNLLFGLAALYRNGHISIAEIETLPDKVSTAVRPLLSL